MRKSSEEITWLFLMVDVLCIIIVVDVKEGGETDHENIFIF